MKIEEINIGDRIYELSTNRIMRVLTVERKTKKWIVCRDERFYISDFGIKPWGASMFDKCTYELETEELIEQFDRQKITRKIERSYWDIDLDRLSIDMLNKFYCLIEDFKVSMLEELTINPQDHE